MKEVVNLLLIEDNPGDVALIEELLSDATYLRFEVVAVDTVDAGRTAMRDQHFDVICSDLGLPDSDGLATVEALVAAAEGTPVVVLTGNRDERIGLEAIRSGAQDFLVKGTFGSELLVRVLDYAMERFQMQTVLHGTLQELSLIHANSPVAMIMVDRDRRVIKLNDAALTIFPAAERSGALGACIGVALHCLNSLDAGPDSCGAAPDCANCVLRNTVLTTFRERRSQRNVELVLPMSDGPTPELLLSTAFFDTPDGERVLVCLQDVSDLKSAQQAREEALAQLNQAQKMESVGRLAGGIAHDFNNLLTGIMGYADLCRDELPLDHPVRPWIDEIFKNTEKSANLTRQLLTFARKQAVHPQVLNLNKDISGILNMLQRLIGEDICLVWKPANDPCLINMDRSQLDQILTNLAVNARDAIQSVGTITISTRIVDGLDMTCPHGALTSPEGRMVCLDFSDTGCGMDAELVDHVFEPFFTTKGVGRGTGLGLSTVYGIVQQHGGFLNVESTPGQGTTFTICFKECEESPVLPDKKAPAHAVDGQGKTVVLVEDEQAIRNTLKRLLEKMGFELIVSEGPIRALELVDAHPGVIDLLLTDIVMPEMNGRELADRIKELHPEAKCLYMSGYTADIIAERGFLDPNTEFLSKPFSRDELARKLREVLG